MAEGSNFAFTITMHDITRKKICALLEKKEETDSL